MATQLQRPDVDGQADKAIVNFRNQLQQRASEFALVLPSHITPEQFQRVVITAVQSEPELLTADRRSLILACMKLAQDAVLPDKREAALVIFIENKKDKETGEWVRRKLVQPMVMVYGLRKKILQSGEITDITAKVVYRREVEEGHFIYEEGTEAMLRHRPMLDLTAEDAADSNIVAAYSMATYKDGSKSYEVMRRFEIDKVRESSQTGATRDRKGQPRNPSGPWVDWFPEQAKKTVMRRHSKTLPMSGDLLDVEGREYDVSMAARSVQTALTPEADAPVRLPSRDDVPPQLEHDEETARTLDQEAFRQFDGRPAYDEDGVVIEPEERRPAQRKRSPQPTEPEAEVSGAAGPATSAEPVAADNAPESHARPAETRTAAPMSLDAAKAEIDAAETVIDVSARRARLIGELDDADADALVAYAEQRVDELKGRR